MAKDRDQMTPEDPEDWARLQTSRGQGTGGTGYDRLPGEESRPPLRDRNSIDEAVPEPLETDDLVDPVPARHDRDAAAETDGDGGPEPDPSTSA